MKKTVKIVTLIVSAILLIGCMVGISVSAEDNAPAVAIKYKNLAYEGAIQVLYAVEAENVPEGAKVQMYFYDTKDATEPSFIKDEYTDEALIIGGKTYRAFFSKGIAPKNMRKPIYAAPVIVNGDEIVAKGELVEYSIYTYATNMLAKAPTAEQKALYTALLDYGAGVQEVLLGTNDYTEADFEAAGGYANEYCGVKINVSKTNGSGTAFEEGAVTYYRPGTEVKLSAPLYKDEYSFVGFVDEELKTVGNYGTSVSVVVSEPCVRSYTAKYVVLESDEVTKTVNLGSQNYSVGNSTYIFRDLESEESENTVLKLNHPAVAKPGNLNFMFHSSGEAYIFEADVKWGGSTIDRSTDNWIQRWGFVSTGTSSLSNADSYLCCNYAATKIDSPLYFTGGNAEYKTEAPTNPQATYEVGDWQRIRFEYVPLGENGGLYYGIQRIYVDGELAEEKIVAAKGDNSDVLYFQIGNRGSGDTMDWSMMFDNIVCHTVAEDYYGQGIYRNDPDTNTYDGDNKNHTAGTIVEDVNGNKVLSATKKTGSGLTVEFTADGYEYGETYVFDTDIKLVSMPYAEYARNWLGRSGFTSSATHTLGGEDKAFVHRSYYGATPYRGMILSDSADSNYGEATYKKAHLTPGTWYNLRVEFTPTGVTEDGKYTGVEKTYLNNVLVTTENASASYDNRGLYSYKFAFLSPNTVTLHYDNTFVGAVGEATNYRNASFEDNLTSSGYFKASNTNGDAVSEYAVVDNPKGDGKVLKATLSTGSNQEINKITTMNGEYDNAPGVYELSYDMLYEGECLPKNNVVIQQFVVQNDKGYTALFTLKHTTDGNVNINSDTDGGTRPDGTPNRGKGGSLGTVKLLDGEWHNLRFVMYTNGTDSVYALYVDGELSGIGNYYHGIIACVDNIVTTNYALHRIKNLNPADSNVTSANLYLDNVGLVYLGDIPEEIPDWTK